MVYFSSYVLLILPLCLAVLASSGLMDAGPSWFGRLSFLHLYELAVVGTMVSSLIRNSVACVKQLPLTRPLIAMLSGWARSRCGANYCIRIVRLRWVTGARMPTTNGYILRTDRSFFASS